MGGWIVPIIVMLIVSAIGKNAKKVAKNRPGQGHAPRPQRPGQPDWKQILPPELRELIEGEEGQVAEQFPAVEAEPSPEGAYSLEGVSREEEDGCVGGTLPHGETPDEGYFGGSPLHGEASGEGYFGGSLPRLEKDRLAPPKAARPLVCASIEDATPAIPHADLRRAMVLAEMLARPVALRPRGYRL